MAGRETYPVARGSTYYGRSQTVPTTFEGRTALLEGIEATFKHTDPSDPTKVLSNRTVRAILMRNVSGITVVAGMGVTEQAGQEGKRFDGYSCVTAEATVGVVDDHLTSAGCRANDMCWVQIEGPTYGRFAGDATLTVGDWVHADTADGSTANTTGGTTANDGGMFTPWLGLTSSATESTDGTAAQKVLNSWGRAMTAGTTDNTAGNYLIDLMIKR